MLVYDGDGKARNTVKSSYATRSSEASSYWTMGCTSKLDSSQSAMASGNHAWINTLATARARRSLSQLQSGRAISQSHLTSLKACKSP